MDSSAHRTVGSGTHCIMSGLGVSIHVKSNGARDTQMSVPENASEGESKVHIRERQSV